MKLEAFVESLAPFDIILIQGITPFSKLITHGSELVRGNGQFSHCALVVNADVCSDIPGMKYENINDLFLMEVTVSTFEKTPDVIMGDSSIGAQIRNIKDILQEYLDSGAGVAVCHLKNNIYLNAKNRDDQLTLAFIRSVMHNIYDQYFLNDKTVYELNLFSLLGTIFPSMQGIRDNIDNMFEFIRDEHPWLFCSELICIVYKKLGMISRNIDVQDYLPVDFVDMILMSSPVFLKKIQTTNKKSIKFWQYVCCIKPQRKKIE